MSVKIKKIKSTVAESFGEIINLDKVDPYIAYTKYNDILGVVTKIRRIIKLLFEVSGAENNSLVVAIAGIDKFLTQYEPHPETYKAMAFTKSFDDNSSEVVVRDYTNVKSSDIINYCITTLSKLSDHKVDFGDKNKCAKFVRDLCGRWSPFTFCDIDVYEFKLRGERDVDNFVSILSFIYTQFTKIHKIIIKADVDISNVILVLETTLCDLEKHGELNRCKKAFNKIRSSMNILRDNFDNYYESFLINDNKVSILESYIVDLTTKEGDETMDVETKMQFGKILSVYRKLAESCGDKKIQNLYKCAEKSMN